MEIAKEKVSCFYSVKLAFVNYKDFSGRCRRSEYWNFFGLLSLIASLFIFLTIYFCVIDPYRIIIDRPGYHYEEYVINWTAIIIMIILDSLLFLIFILPLISATVRRLHDTGKSGFFIFIGIIPLLGQIYLLFLLCKDSDEKKNEYDASPKYNSNDLIPV